MSPERTEAGQVLCKQRQLARPRIFSAEADSVTSTSETGSRCTLSDGLRASKSIRAEENDKVAIITDTESQDGLSWKGPLKAI